MRIRSLDGLRGLAAVVVLVHHALLGIPALAEPYMTGRPAENAVAAAVLYTPLHVFWEGRAAVFVFFILSGIVLTLPVMKAGRDFSWRSYYPQRLVRLYLPVWAAVVLAIAWVVAIPRDGDIASAWLQARAWSPGIRPILGDVTLVAGNGDTISPLWSLQWEILFSLLLPVFVLIAVRCARYWWAVVVASLLLIAGSGWVGGPALTYLPMFLIGSAMATALPRLIESGKRLAAPAGWAFTLFASVALVTPWIAHGAIGTSRTFPPMIAVSVLGATVAVYLAIAFEPIRTALETRALQWFGLIAFSLYLVHEPVLISAAYLLGDDLLPVALVLGGVVSIALAYVFYRLVEKPSQRLARTIGSAVRERTRKRELAPRA